MNVIIIIRVKKIAYVLKLNPTLWSYWILL